MPGPKKLILFFACLLLGTAATIACSQEVFEAPLEVHSVVTPPELSEPTPAKPLSIESETVEVTTTTETLERTRVVFGTFELAGSSKIVGESSKQRNATLVVTSEAPRAAYAYTTDFETVELLEVDETSFLLDASPGRYLLVFDTDTGSKIRPVVVERSGPDSSELGRQASDLADAIDDQPTKLRIGTELAAIAYNLTAPGVTFDDAKAKVQLAIETALMDRAGESLKKDWINGFRRPLQKAIQELGIETAEDYAEAIQAIAGGLIEPVPDQANAAQIDIAVATVTPLSARFPPAWEQPPGPHLVGQVHDGRKLVKECISGLPGHCRLVWRAIAGAR